MGIGLWLTCKEFALHMGIGVRNQFWYRFVFIDCWFESCYLRVICLILMLYVKDCGFLYVSLLFQKHVLVWNWGVVNYYHYVVSSTIFLIFFLLLIDWKSLNFVGICYIPNYTFLMFFGKCFCCIRLLTWPNLRRFWSSFILNLLFFVLIGKQLSNNICLSICKLIMYDLGLYNSYGQFSLHYPLNLINMLLLNIIRKPR